MSLITRNKPTEATPEAIAKARGYAAMASQPGMQFDVQGRTVIQLADTLALVNGALTEAESAFRAEQAEKVTEQNRADRLQVKLTELAASIPHPGTEARTIILTREATKPWDVIENGRSIDRLGNDEALFVLAHLLTGAKGPLYNQKWRTPSEAYSDGIAAERFERTDRATGSDSMADIVEEVDASFDKPEFGEVTEACPPRTMYHPDIVLPNGQGVDFKTGKASPEGNTSQNQLYRAMAEEAGATWSEKPARMGDIQLEAKKHYELPHALDQLFYNDVHGKAFPYSTQSWLQRGYDVVRAHALYTAGRSIAKLMNKAKTWGNGT